MNNMLLTGVLAMIAAVTFGLGMAAGYNAAMRGHDFRRNGKS